MFVVFVFKQKTAYERRISDWSSDVCASDLREVRAVGDVEQIIGPVGLVQRGAKLQGDSRKRVFIHIAISEKELAFQVRREDAIVQLPVILGYGPGIRLEAHVVAIIRQGAAAGIIEAVEIKIGRASC